MGPPLTHTHVGQNIYWEDCLSAECAEYERKSDACARWERVSTMRSLKVRKAKEVQKYKYVLLISGVGWIANVKYGKRYGLSRGSLLSLLLRLKMPRCLCSSEGLNRKSASYSMYGQRC